MADGVELPAEAAGNERARVRYSEDVAGRIVARVAGGESVPRICRDRGMPHATSVYDWARREPRFGRALSVAHQAARAAQLKAQRRAAAERWARGRDPRGRWSTYTPELGAEICWRLIEGQTLKVIGDDPEMPCAATILRWVREIPDFEDAYVQARDMLADVMFDEIRDEAKSATPATVWVARTRIDAALKMLRLMRPRKYCERVLAEAAIAERRGEEDPDRQGLVVILKRPEDITEEEHRNAALTEQGYFDRPRRR
jgi:hypothetical protein